VEGYKDAGDVEILSINPMQDDLDKMGIGSGVMGIGASIAKKVAKKTTENAIVNLTKKESKYLKELMGDTGGGKFTSEIIEEVPSLVVRNNKLSVDKSHLNSFSKYLDDLYQAQRAPSGPGANTIPPGLRGYNNNIIDKLLRQNKANGGIIGLMNGGQPVEMDYRMGGMIPIGSKERADDVPARLSKNEFVMTADAVRAAGGGSVNEGAKRMYELMNNLEAKV
jgi:hypothetical protein